MNKAFESISKGLQEAVDYSLGEDVEVRVFEPDPINLKELRNHIGMTQREFATTFGISLGTLRHWERGDRQPRGAALVLLNLLQKNPKAILEVLYG